MVGYNNSGNHFEIRRKIRKNIEIYLQGWTSSLNNKAVICLVHGLGEHSGRYESFADFFIEQEYSVIAVDLYGHGKSEGRRGHIPSYEMFMNNIELLIEEAFNRFSSPCFLYGHSMGGNLVLNYVLRYQSDLKGVVASAPWLKLASKPTFIKRVMVKIIDYIYPEFTQSNGIDAQYLSHNEGEAEDYEEDKLVHDKISAHLYTELSNAGEWAVKNMSKINLPGLIMHGTEDKITSFKTSRGITADIKNLTFKKWEGLYHELHNEPEKEEVYKYVLEWMNKILY